MENALTRQNTNKQKKAHASFFAQRHLDATQEIPDQLRQIGKCGELDFFKMSDLNSSFRQVPFAVHSS